MTTPLRCIEEVRKQDGLFTADDDLVWELWYGLQGPDQYTLRELVFNSHFRDGFVARAMTLLLSTYKEEGFPSSWGKGCRSFPSRGVYRILTRPVKDYVAQLLCELVDRYNQQQADCPGHMNDLQHTLRYVLAELPKDSTTAEAVYKKIDLKWDNPIDRSANYRGFYLLLADERLSQAWKKRADTDMRKEVLAAIADRTGPKDTRELADVCYPYHLASLRGLETFPLDLDLYDDQWRFAIAHLGKQTIKETMGLYSVFDFYSDSGRDNKDLALYFTKLVLEDGLYVHTENEERRAERLLKKFPRERLVCADLRKAIAAGEEKRNADAEHRRNIAEVVSRMQ